MSIISSFIFRQIIHILPNILDFRSIHYSKEFHKIVIMHYVLIASNFMRNFQTNPFNLNNFISDFICGKYLKITFQHLKICLRRLVKKITILMGWENVMVHSWYLQESVAVMVSLLSKNCLIFLYNLKYFRLL